MTTNENTVQFNPEIHFDMSTYCAARHCIDRNKNIASAKEMPKEDIDFISKAIHESSEPTSLAIWSHLQRAIPVLFALHPHICGHMVKIATEGGPVLKAYMNMPQGANHYQKISEEQAALIEGTQENWHAKRDAAYSAYLVSIGQSV